MTLKKFKYYVNGYFSFSINKNFLKQNTTKSFKMRIFMILLLISIFIHSSYSALRFDGLNIRIVEKSKSEFFQVIS